MVRQLLDGQLDGIILGRVMADSLVRLLPEANPGVQLAVSPGIFGAAVAYGAHDPRRAVNTIIEQLRMDGRLAEIHARYFAAPPPDMPRHR